jgi:hypothetical protein
LQLGNLRLACVHGFFADALAFAGIGYVQPELLGDVRGKGDADRAGIEQRVKRTAAIEANFDEDAIVYQVER